MTYPIYIEYALGYRRVESEETYTAVNDDVLEFGIIRMSRAKNIINAMVKNGTRVSEACFNNAFQNALTKLNLMLLDEMVPEGRGPSTEDLKVLPVSEVL